MDEERREHEQHTKSLERLVKARTDQLQEMVRQRGQLLELLKQIQSMKSLEEAQRSAQHGIAKFAPEPVSAPSFGGQPGEPVPRK